ncbi:MAG: hypothetical protein MJK14_07475 [Rivularia sp. ALOHA_DT_140]|nr:hypothetical protein [Rivularia sp. ALOHA_DT_140]
MDGSSDITGDYSFRLLDLASATDLNLDTPVTGTLQPGTETDLFRFEATAGQRLFLDDLSSESGGFYIIYGPGNQFITSQNIAGFEREFTLPADGDYIIAVRGFGETPLNYQFRLV